MKRTVERFLIAFAAAVCLCVQTLAMPETLIPVGRTVGIRLCGELRVAALEDRAEAAGLRAGDRIVSVDGAAVRSVEELRQRLCGKTVRIGVERDGEQLEYAMEPALTADGPRIGVRIRDGISGVGTVTFYDPATGRFGALGHGVNDPESGRPVRSTGGSIMDCSIRDVRKGSAGAPGELHGAIASENPIGEIEKNTSAGIFGTMAAPAEPEEALPLAGPDLVRTGQAQILSNVDGDEVRSFSVEILKVDKNDAEGRNFLLRVCDDALLSQTGGIVQGMSGSPIIQDGRFIGAVTHVLVDDPTVGYGIAIETMLQAADAALHQKKK